MITLQEAKDTIDALYKEFGPDVTLENAAMGIRSAVTESEREEAYSKMIKALDGLPHGNAHH